MRFLADEKFPATARSSLPALVVDLVAKHGEKLTEHFVMLQPRRVRFSR
jgi:hypothetical protein